MSDTIKVTITEVQPIKVIIKNSVDLGNPDAMTKAVYDPTGKEADAFSMNNMAESATAKILTNVERTGPTQIEAETGTSIVTKLWSALRVRQAIVAWAVLAASVFKGKLSRYTEDQAVLTFTAGAASMDVTTSVNIRTSTLDQNSTLTTSNRVAYKQITFEVIHSGGPWTLSLDGQDVGLVGAASDTEMFVALWTGAVWLISLPIIMVKGTPP